MLARLFCIFFRITNLNFSIFLKTSKLFLNVLPGGAEPSKWEEIIVQKRKEYEQLKKEISIDPHQETNEDLLVNNPLSQVEDVSSIFNF